MATTTTTTTSIQFNSKQIKSKVKDNLKKLKKRLKEFSKSNLSNQQGKRNMQTIKLIIKSCNNCSNKKQVLDSDNLIVKQVVLSQQSHPLVAIVCQFFRLETKSSAHRGFNKHFLNSKYSPTSFAARTTFALFVLILDDAVSADKINTAQG